MSKQDNKKQMYSYSEDGHVLTLNLDCDNSSTDDYSFPKLSDEYIITYDSSTAELKCEKKGDESNEG